jgi:radical SAM superfamily enzyme YgiQ (UPF0313 family)
MKMKLVYPRWPRLEHQTEFHLPPHGPINFAAVIPKEVELTFVDENRQELDTDDNPDVVALSVMLTCQLPRAKEIASAYRRRDIPVIAGGIAVMLHAQEMAEAVDAVFLGEVEENFGGVMEDLRQGTPRNVYDCMQRLPSAASIDSARRDILDYSLYTYRGVRMLDPVHASRGCRYNCPPCPTAFLGGRKFRPRPIEKVIKEIESIDNRRLFFVDNALAQDDEWQRDLFRSLAPLGRTWVSHPISADDEILDLASRSGCWYVYQAITDVSEAIRERIGRYQEHDIGVEGTIILGDDNHDRDDVLRLIDFVMELDLDMAEFTILTPFPHTQYRQAMEGEGRILHNDWSEYTTGKVVFQPKHMSPAELQDLYHLAWERFYGENGQQVKMARLFQKALRKERAREAQETGVQGRKG